MVNDINGKDHYVAMLMDLHSRNWIGCAVSDKIDTDLVLKTFESALRTRGNLLGCIHHTDSDSRYCSEKFTQSVIDVRRVAEKEMEIKLQFFTPKNYKLK